MSREVRRVPVDFDWPLNQRWQGYLMPDYYDEDPCPDCGHRARSGYTEFAAALWQQWYGHAPFRPEDNGSTPHTPATPEVDAFAIRNVDRDPDFYIGRWYRPDMPHADVERQAAINVEARRLCKLWNRMWMHHLNQDDVDLLVAADRLRDLTHTFDPVNRWQPKDPPVQLIADEVNRWGIQAGLFGVSSSEGYALITARCEAAGELLECPTCEGNGTVEKWPGQRAEGEAWQPTPPPPGDGWQLWETVTEGSPVGPVFHTADALAGWLTTVDGGDAVGFGRYSEPMTWEQAQGFVKAGSSIGSFVMVDGVTQNGAAAMGSLMAAEEQS